VPEHRGRPRKCDNERPARDVRGPLPSHANRLEAYVKASGCGMSGRPLRRDDSVEVELVSLDVLHHEARLVVAIGKQ